MANQETGSEVEGTDHLKEYKNDINEIIRDCFSLLILGLFLLMILWGTDVLLRPNPFGMIADPSCIPGPDVIVNLAHSHFISILAPGLAFLLAIWLKITLCCTSNLHEAVIRSWIFISAVIVLIGHVFFYVTVVDSLQLVLGSLSCATNLTSLVLAVLYGFVLSMVIALFIMTRFSVSFSLSLVFGVTLYLVIILFIIARFPVIFVLAVVLGSILCSVIIALVISRCSAPR